MKLLHLILCLISTLLLSFIYSESAFATTTYMDPTLGSDCTDGNYSVNKKSCTGSDGNAFNRLQEAIDASKPGDTILVRGGTWSESNIVIRNRSKTADLTVKAYPGEQPIIDNNDYTGAPGDFNKVIYINDTEGVTIDGLEIREWSIGLYVLSAKNCTIRNNKIHDMWSYCLAVQKSPGTTIEDNDIYRGIWRKELTGKVGGGIVVLHYDNSGTIVRRNKIHDSYWEGMNVGRCTENIIVEYNIIYGNFEAQLYILNNRNIIARYNLIYGTPGSNPSRGGYGPGIWLSMESHEECPSDYFNGHHKIYGNLVANTSANLWVTAQKDASGNSYPIIDTEVYNNTFISGRDVDVRYREHIGEGHIFKNNIIWSNGAGDITINTPSEKIDADYNLWSKKPNAAFIGPNDSDYGVPNFKKMTGWSNLKDDELDGSEFSISDDSFCVNKGIKLDSFFQKILDVSRSNWKTKTFIFADQSANGSGWEIGADVAAVNQPTEFVDPPVLKIKNSASN